MVGLMPGHNVQQFDAVQACIEIALKKALPVAIPRGQWPEQLVAMKLLNLRVDYIEPWMGIPTPGGMLGEALREALGERGLPESWSFRDGGVALGSCPSTSFL